jgi:hypothetical protein
VHVLGLGYEAEAPRTDQHPRGEIAEHAAELQPLKERHEHDDGEQENGGKME